MVQFPNATPTIRWTECHVGATGGLTENELSNIKKLNVVCRYME